MKTRKEQLIDLLIVNDLAFQNNFINADAHHQLNRDIIHILKTIQDDDNN